MTETDINSPQQKEFKTKDLFKIRNFRLLWAGQVISDLGNSMTRLALLLLINHLTGSTAAIATMTIVLAVPRLIFGLLSGVYVDRFNRKHIMIFSDLTRGILVLGFLFVNSAERIWILYVIAFLQGCVATFFDPARSAIIPNLVPKEGLLAANSISQTTQILFELLGTGATGVLVGIFNNFSIVFGLDALTFILSLLFVSMIRYQFAPQKGEKVSFNYLWEQLSEGVKVTFNNRFLAGSILAIGLTMLGIGAVNVLLVPLLVNELQMPETWFGLVNLSQTIAMVISGSMIAGLAARFQPTKLMTFGLIGLGIGIGAMFFAVNIWIVLAALFFSALFVPAISSSTQTIIQTAVPDELRGRTGAARSTLVQIANLLSMGAAGAFAELIGIRTFFAFGGLCAIAAGLAASFIFRQNGKEN